MALPAMGCAGGREGMDGIQRQKQTRQRGRKSEGAEGGREGGLGVQEDGERERRGRKARRGHFIYFL